MHACTHDLAVKVSIFYSSLLRVLQQFLFAFSNSRLDFPGIPKFTSCLILSSLINLLINWDGTYHMLSLTNFQSYECDDLQQFYMLSDVCFSLLVCFCRFQWHLIYIFFVFLHNIFLTGNYFPEITFCFPDHFPKSHYPGIAAIGYFLPLFW